MNSFLFLILSIFIIANKLFLFNEEFLILICFIAFCYVTYIKLSPQINLRFQNKIIDLEDSLLNSFNYLKNNLKQKKKLNVKLAKFKFILKSLKKYYKLFSYKFLNEFLRYKKFKKKIILVNQLHSFLIIEKEYSKFIISLLLNKLNNIANLLNFFNFRIKIKRFQAFNKINKLNLLKKI